MELSEIAANQYLKRYPIGNLFSVPVKDRLSVNVIDKDEYLFGQNDALKSLYFLVKGRAKTYIIHSNGAESLVCFLYPGTLMGDMELVGGVTESYMVKAIERCIAIKLPLQDYRETILHDVKFLKILCRIISNKLHDNDIRFSAMQAFPLKKRLAAFLLSVQYDNRFTELLTATAQHLGVSYRNLQRVVASFCSDGILKRDKKGFVILRPDILNKLAEGVDVFQKRRGFLDYL